MDIREFIDIIVSISNNIFILLLVFLYSLSNYELYKHKRINRHWYWMNDQRLY